MATTIEEKFNELVNAADMRMRPIISKRGLALCHAAFELGWDAGDDEYKEQKARIDALRSQPMKGRESTRS